MLNRIRAHLRPKPNPPSPPVVLDNHLLAGKNALITGAGRNIGRAIALEMARQGANIYFTDIDAERSDQLTRDLASLPVRSMGFLCNNGSQADIDRLCRTLDDQQIEIDVLVNNAGTQVERPSVDLKIADWQRTFDVNLFGTLHLTQQITRRMLARAQAGTIIFITSIHQWEVIGWPSYSASKAALGMAIKELAVELAPHAIRVNGIAPGWVNEDGTGRPHRSTYSLLHQMSIPPHFIGRAAVYLAADYFSQYTTGSILKIDAGMSLHNIHVSGGQQR